MALRGAYTFPSELDLVLTNGRSNDIYHSHYRWYASGFADIPGENRYNGRLSLGGVDMRSVAHPPCTTWLVGGPAEPGAIVYSVSTSVKQQRWLSEKVRDLQIKLYTGLLLVEVRLGITVQVLCLSTTERI